MSGQVALLASSVLTVLIASALLTGWVRRQALAHRLLDVPNERSSHTRPTPRGGGLAIVITMLCSVAVLGVCGVIAPRLSLALGVSGAAIATVGLLDDRGHVPVRVRLAVHFAAVAILVAVCAPLPPIDFGSAVYDLGSVGTLTGVLGLVWLVNLYNFMDGIDGIASIEAISVAFVGAAILLLHGSHSPAIALLLSTAAATGGFLLWNWPPARIFMGDAGSGFLGFLLGSIAWLTVTMGDVTVWFWLILLGAFFVDATVTLLRRGWRGAPLASAHRSHAYQRLSRNLGSHRVVTLGCLAVNLLWLAPLAALAAAHPSWGIVLALIAWAPLVLIVWRAGAGLPD